MSPMRPSSAILLSFDAHDDLNQTGRRRRRLWQCRERSLESSCFAGALFGNWFHHSGRGHPGVLPRQAGGLLAAHALALHCWPHLRRSCRLRANDPHGDSIDERQAMSELTVNAAPEPVPENLEAEMFYSGAI